MSVRIDTPPFLVIDGEAHLTVVETDLDHVLTPRAIINQDMVGTVLSTLCGRWRNFIRQVQSLPLSAHYSYGYLQYPNASEPGHVLEVASVDPMSTIWGAPFAGLPAEPLCPECSAHGLER